MVIFHSDVSLPEGNQYLEDLDGRNELTMLTGV